MENITQFFYNIIPGLLFICGISWITGKKVEELIGQFSNNKDTAILVSFLFIGSLFIGFLFQGITKFAREKFRWNDWAFESVTEDPTNQKLIEQINSTLFGKTKMLNKKELKRTFYTMHNVLEAKGLSGFARHYETRFALWSNILNCGIILFLLSLALSNEMKLFKPITFIVISNFAFWQSNKHLHALYDVILKTFYGLSLVNENLIKLPKPQRRNF